MLVGNLCLAQPDLELILLNSGILCGAALLALLPMPQRRARLPGALLKICAIFPSVSARFAA